MRKSTYKAAYAASLLESVYTYTCWRNHPPVAYKGWKHPGSNVIRILVLIPVQIESQPPGTLATVTVSDTVRERERCNFGWHARIRRARARNHGATEN